MINENMNVEGCVANGAMAEFRGVNLADGVTYSNLEKICIDGYYVWCAKASQIKSIRVSMIDGRDDNSPEIVVDLEAHSQTAVVDFPSPVHGTITENTPRFKRTMKMTQFPINVANARTVHKLQGRSIENMVISTWDYTDNWIYVALSRCTTLKGLFLRKPLVHAKTRGMSEECKSFHKFFRETKSPPARAYNNM
jgi:hypothetical protein